MSRPALEIANTAVELLEPFEICQKEFLKAKEIVEKINNRDITISVIGQFKRGKSTLVNAILDDDILPVGIVPVTAVVTEIKYGEKSAEIRFHNGIVKKVPFEELHTYINEQENPNNQMAVKEVTMFAPADFLKEGLTFVDTPGVGSIHQNNTDAAYAYVKESDACIFMLSVDSPINQIEIDFLRNAKQFASKFYFAVNKIDVINETDLQAYLAYCEKLLCDIMEVESIHMFPVSAKTGFGIGELKTNIIRDYRNSIMEIIEESSKKKLTDIIDSCMSHIKLYSKACQIPMDEAEIKFRDINETLDDILDSANEEAREINKKAYQLAQDMLSELDEFKNIDLSMSKALMIEICKKYLISLKTWSFIKANEIDAKINEYKNLISREVKNAFYIDYHYDIPELSMNGFGFGTVGDELEKLDASIDNFDDMKEALIDVIRQAAGEKAEELSSKILKEAEELCQELKDSLNKILMYREENALIVVKRVEALNALVRHLRSLRVKI